MFDMFDKRHQTSWETVMSKFNDRVIQIEEMTKKFINGAFSHLRSAHVGSKKIKTRRTPFASSGSTSGLAL